MSLLWSRGETLAVLQARVAAAVVIVLGRVLTGRVPDSVDADDFHA